MGLLWTGMRERKHFKAAMGFLGLNVIGFLCFTLGPVLTEPLHELHELDACAARWICSGSACATTSNCWRTATSGSTSTTPSTSCWGSRLRSLAACLLANLLVDSLLLKRRAAFADCPADPVGCRSHDLRLCCFGGSSGSGLILG
jgi:hypothetical protein